METIGNNIGNNTGNNGSARRNFVFSDILEAKRSYESYHPYYEEALGLYEPLEEEIKNKRIMVERCQLVLDRGQVVRGRFYATKPSELIGWHELIDDLQMRKIPVDSRTIGEMLYVLYLMAVDTEKSRKEIEDIFCH